MPWKQYILKTRVHLYINVSGTSGPNSSPSRGPLYANSVAVTRIFGPPTEWPTAQISGARARQVEIPFCSDGNRNSAQWATPLVELALNRLSASEKAVEIGNTMHSVKTHLPNS